jgi:hypothetical protein
MTDPIVPGGAGLPDQQLTPADPAQPTLEPSAAPAEGESSAAAGADWSTSEVASEPSTPTLESAAGFGMPSGGGFEAPAAEAEAPAAPSDSAWGAPVTPAPGASPVAGWTPGTPLTPSSGPRARSRLRPIIIGIVIIAVVVGAVVINALGGSPVGDLKVGDCFDVPTLASEADTVDTVQHHACNQAHTGEVIFVGDYTGGTGAYPAVSDFETFVGNTCKPVFQAYVGTDLDSSSDLSIGYFYPLVDGWTSGQRSVTCYATRTDDGSMTSSVKGSETGAPSTSP